MTITVTPLTGVGPDVPGVDENDDGHGDGDEDEDEDGNGHGDDDDENDDGNLPDTGAPTSDLLALGLTVAFVGSLLLSRPGGLRRVSTRR
ncbi:MAG: LPXTG cell wall anchor domain-containing protein [Aeromicrobium sp.]